MKRPRDTRRQMMRLRQAQCLTNSLKSKAENWMAFHLATTGFRWIRQARWRGRVFDFWCRELGVAVEVDGREHRAEDDARDDRVALTLGNILVYRVRNMNDADAQKVLRQIMKTPSWATRKRLT